MRSIQYWLSIYLLSRKSDIDANDWVEVGDVDCQSVSMSVVKKGLRFGGDTPPTSTLGGGRGMQVYQLLIKRHFM